MSTLFTALQLSPSSSPLLLSLAQLLSGFLGGVFGAALNTPGIAMYSTLAPNFYTHFTDCKSA
ncbi:hypothetical protein EON65_40105 [archaeon]|nr:MAG: hypothetical protein EON65_40105 [archaeon]